MEHPPISHDIRPGDQVRVREKLFSDPCKPGPGFTIEEGTVALVRTLRYSNPDNVEIIIDGFRTTVGVHHLEKLMEDTDAGETQ